MKSGRFRHAQLRWPIVDKESYPFGEVLVSLSHWINGGHHPAAFFTDHKNLLAIFCPDAREDNCSKPNQQRRERWALNMRALWYQIFHIDGEENRLADLGTRWGNRFLSREAFKRGLRVGPTRLFKAWTRDKHRHGAGCHKCAMRLAPIKLSDNVVYPDGDADPEFTLPKLTDMVSMSLIKREQKAHAKSRPSHYVLDRGVWRNEDNEAWIPDGAKQLQHLLYAVAHQGVSGHRGREVTMKLLQGRVRWTHMERDVRAWRQGCLQ